MKMKLLGVLMGSIPFMIAVTSVASKDMYWTDWISRDNPTGNGDNELISIIIKEFPDKVCAKHNMACIECRDRKTHTPWYKTGDVIKKPNDCNVDYGFNCENKYQKAPRCRDYEVRFLCKDSSDDCDKLWDGQCRNGCKSKEIKITEDYKTCPSHKPDCCAEPGDTACDDQLDGTCKDKCDNDEITIGRSVGYGGCLCNSEQNDKCCVKKDDDLCEELKGGECMKEQDCNNCNGRQQTKTQLCFKDGEVCCVGEQACERSDPGGICVDKKLYCPEGYSTAEERCETKPVGVYEWCDDHDDLCCIPDKR